MTNDLAARKANLAIAGGAASVTRPDPDDGPDHDALVRSGFLRILGLGGRVFAVGTFPMPQMRSLREIRAAEARTETETPSP